MVISAVQIGYISLYAFFFILYLLWHSVVLKAKDSTLHLRGCSPRDSSLQYGGVCVCVLLSSNLCTCACVYALVCTVYMPVREEIERVKCEYSSRTVRQPVTPRLWILNLSKCHFEEVGWISASLHSFYFFLSWFLSMLPSFRTLNER